MDRDIREAVSAEAIAAALFAPLAAGFELAEAEQKRIKIEDAFGPERVAGDVADTRQPILTVADAERFLRQADRHTLRIEHADVAEMQSALFFNNGHVRHQRAIALERFVEVVDLKAEMVKTGGAPRFVQLRAPLQESDIEEAVSGGDISLI